MERNATLINVERDKLDPNGAYEIPAMFVPSFRKAVAGQRGVKNKILLKTWGGLGDQICAEPTLRFALDRFKEYEISLDAMVPELFTHLKFHKVYDQKKNPANEDEFDVFHTICSDQDFFWEYVCHLYTHCIDFPSICAFRSQLPRAYREIQLHPSQEIYDKITPLMSDFVNKIPFVVLHPGKHWQSKTFPKWWWDRVISYLKRNDCLPVIIGGHADDINGLRTTVDVDTEGCVDFRNKFSVMETVAILKKSRVLLTNDSAPLHMAASTNAWIGFVSMNKHPEYITHTRYGEFGWRMKSFELGGVWDISHFLSDINVQDIGENLEKWLPIPEELGKWALYAGWNYFLFKD